MNYLFHYKRLKKCKPHMHHTKSFHCRKTTKSDRKQIFIELLLSSLVALSKRGFYLGYVYCLITTGKNKKYMALIFTSRHKKCGGHSF